MSEGKVLKDIVNVDFAKNIKRDLLYSSVLECPDESLKRKINSADENQLIVITSTINSPKTIKDVQYYDKEYIANML